MSQHPLEITWEPYSDGSYSPEYDGYTAAPYCTGNPELGWCLYSRGAGGCWNQRTKQQLPFKEGWEPVRVGGKWFWSNPNATPKGSVLRNFADCNA